ncbi:MAG: NDP-hexose 2,3-dehydratase family protein [Desulfobacterota bacterium]|nr:NDP-hexose 2,3-dehydratase family protein [Thermodesulfobacteriota bacterium]
MADITATSLAQHFLKSALIEDNCFQSTDAFLTWFSAKKTNHHFSVRRIPFSKLTQWFFEEATSNLKHASGRFFSIEGIRVTTNVGPVSSWDQPIINQPEIGILGIITREIDGVLYFLMQAKMEPGNVNILQLSPTVQATKSNFTQVHGGKLPPYLEYFLERKKSRFLIDMLQTEQGGRFLHKRNRNMIVMIDHDIEVLDDFCWLTLGQIKRFLRCDNFVNMDARSVLSCIPFPNWYLGHESAQHMLPATSDDFSRSLILSLLCPDSSACHSLCEILSWFTELKTKYQIHVERIPLKDVRHWKRTDFEICHERYPLFSVIAVSVEAGTREVFSWTQPLLMEQQQGLLGFLTKKINGTLHFLMQAKLEPGNRDGIEIAPTVSCSALTFKQTSGFPIPFLERFVNAHPCHIRYDVVQSEEGGRFYHFLNRNMVIELDECETIEAPENYIWMTLGQIMELVKHGYMNIDARTLLSCIGLQK